MNSIFRGERVSAADFIDRLEDLEALLEKDLERPPLDVELVIEAANKLVLKFKPDMMTFYLMQAGMSKWKAKSFIEATTKGLKKEALTKKVLRELGPDPLNWRQIEEGIIEKNYPLGVLMHIGAGNAIGLSALSVLEGLLAGNINILKLPSYEGGLSVELLMQLIEIEPQLKPYIYVIDVASSDKNTLNHLSNRSNAIVVWGSNETTSQVRKEAPSNIHIIEWGHRISFAYFTNHAGLREDLYGLARDICISDQQYCSSPQCVFYETDNKEEVDRFADDLKEAMTSVSNDYPADKRSQEVEAQISWVHELIKMEALLGEKKLLKNLSLGFSVMVDYETRLKAAPLFRNIWVMPIKRGEIIRVLRKNKGYLQTVGLSCHKSEEETLSNAFYIAGVNRVKTCGAMHDTYSGEPHDGYYTLDKYVRKVSKTIGR
jgi:acyl-CoA reductase-like NAD-dependent aldehyde dehydrogenase